MLFETLTHAPPLPATRSGALQRLEEFLPESGKYSRRRNHVLPGHPNVSRLSPAIRHRLLTEGEVIAAPLTRYAPSTVEKFTQEVMWRRYWKAWLSLRPQVWTEYRRELQDLQEDSAFTDVRARAEDYAHGHGPIAVMNHFADELRETGYLHNHARMWFAGWWIHVARLPWQLGAHFFYQHLLDADPASNTLSWRWVAGLQTPGKTYLPRRSNIEKYLDPEILAAHSSGLELLEKPSAHLPDLPPKPAITQRELSSEAIAPGLTTGLWVHEEDLLPEQGPLAGLDPSASLVTGDSIGWSREEFSTPHRRWLAVALSDTARRIEDHFGNAPTTETRQPLPEALANWARQNELEQVVTLRPAEGLIADQLPTIRHALKDCETSLVLVDRPDDLAVRTFATGGFFGFWKKWQA